jgi:hypothetical protein
MVRCLILSLAAWVSAGAPASLRADPPATNAFPEVGVVLQGLVERAKDDARLDREFEAGYQFTHTKIREERNLKGEVRKREAERAVQTPRSGANPAPGWRGEGAARVTQGAAAKPEKAGRPYEKDDVLLTESLVRRFEFTIRAREEVAGRTVLKLDFRPAAEEAPTRGLLDRFINHTAGTIWVDEADYTIAKAVFWLTEKLSFGGGILGSVSAFDGRFERGRTEEGRWFTTNVEWQVECREFLVNKLIEFRETREDVRKAPPPTP